MTTKRTKTIALVFVILMFGSTFAYTLFNALGGQGNELKIPSERILTHELNKQQTSYLLRRGYTLIKYNYPTGCLDCIDVKNRLEWMTQNSEGQIFLQELSGESSKLTVISWKNQKTVYDPKVGDLETIVCDLLMKEPIWCVTSKI